MLEFKKGKYISRAWFLHHPDAGVDVFAWLWRELPQGDWHFSYRFRYYRDDRAHDSSDRKSGYQGAFNEPLSEAQVLERIQPVLGPLSEMLGQQFGTPPFEVACCEIGTDDPADAVRLLSLEPWAHLKCEPLPD